MSSAPPHVTPLWTRKTAKLLVVASFWATATLFVAASVWLASESVHPGSPDSMNNLATARNLAEGRGFTSQVVHQFFEPQPLPNPETVRPPGLPYLLALGFLLTGVHLAWPVVWNAAFLLGSALALRGGLLRLGTPTLVAHVLSMLVILTGAYQPHSAWNNNAMVFFTMLLFWVGSLRLTGAVTLLPFAVLAGAIGGLGFLMKQTFVMSAVPASLLLILAPAGSEERGRRIGAACAMLAVFAAISSPYWIRNLVLFGEPLYNPMTSLRVLARYGGESGIGLWPSGTWRTVRYDRALGLDEVIAAAGLRWVVVQELCTLGQSLGSIARINPFVVALAAGSTLALRRIGALPTLFVLALLGESVFTLFYISVNPRYLWPVQPCLLVLVGLASRELPAFAFARSAWNRVAVGLLALLLGCALVAGTRQLQGRFEAAFAEAKAPPPPWVAHVREAVPVDGVVITQNPWPVWFFAERSGLMAPTSGRDALLDVLGRHRPTHFLDTREAALLGRVPFAPTDLELVHVETKGRAWALYRVKPFVLDLATPGTRSDPELAPRPSAGCRVGA